jgi:hypothetical protein
MYKLLLASLTLAFASALFAADSQKVTGLVVDAKCATKMKDPDCAKSCIKNGEPPVIVSDLDQKVWTVDNPDALKSHAGERVTVSAKLDSSKNSLHVDKVEAAK